MSLHALHRRLAVALAAAAVISAAWSHPIASPCAASANGIAARSPDAPGASQFVQSVAGLSDHDRDDAVRDQLLAGNLPGFLRQAQPISVVASLPGRGPVRLTMCVLADYLALGSDDDFLLIPIGLDTALAVARRFGFTLPTRRMVDLVYSASAVRLAPQPLPAGDDMRSIGYALLHQQRVQAQRDAFGAPWGRLTAGHKKDLVLTPRLRSQPDRVAIYGWHRGVDEPIQPLSTVHGARYADYSHGVRLVSDVVFIDGRPRSIFDVLADPMLASLVSDEGPVPYAAALRAAPGQPLAGAE